jgi:hypothetical protein
MKISVKVYPHHSLETMSKRWGDPPKQYVFTVQKRARLNSLKEHISKFLNGGVSKNQLVLTGIAKGVISDIIPDDDDHYCSEVPPNFNLVAYEFPATHNDVRCFLKQTERGQQRNCGFPVITSFKRTLTCAEVKLSVWAQVRRIFGERGSLFKGATDEEVYARACELMTVRVVDEISFRKAGVPANARAVENSERPFIGEFVAETNFVYLVVEWDATWLREIDGFRMDYVSKHTSAEEYEREGAGGDTLNLDKCFKSFSNPERLDLDNMWYCSRCKDHRSALKTTKIRQLPNILIINFKRFDNKADKLHTLIDFPIDGLDMSAQCELYGSKELDAGVGGNNEVDATYDLFAVVNHYGRFGFGHYTVFARKWASSKEGAEQGPMEEHFTCFDDSTLTVLKDPRAVVTSAAYCLMYRRRIFV